MYRSYNKKEKLNKEVLTNDLEFLADAETFLRKRRNLKDSLSQDEIYDMFMEHMRSQNVNELTAYGDLEYAQNADLEGKMQFGSLLDAYDNIDDGFSATMLGDYVEGVAKAPSTYLGLATGGVGKGAAFAGTQAAKIGIRKIIGETLKGAARAGVVEAGIATTQDYAQQKARMETGIQNEYDITRAGMTAGTAGIAGGILNLPSSFYTTKAAKEAAEKYEQFSIASARQATEASESTRRVLADADIDDIKYVRSALEELDPEKVAAGRKIRIAKSDSETLIAGLPEETTENLSAAAIRIKNLVKPKENERVTSAVARAIDEGNAELLKEITPILKEHNLTAREFSLFYMAEYSAYGRGLASASKVKKALEEAAPTLKSEKEIVEKLDEENPVKLISEIEKIGDAGVATVSPDEIQEFFKDRGKFVQFFRGLDYARLGLMTMQPATTARNNAGGGLRTVVDIMERGTDNIIQASQGNRNYTNFADYLKDTSAVARYMVNPYEAQVIKRAYSDLFPMESATLFRDNAIVEAYSNSLTPNVKQSNLAKLGAKVNYLNTLSDNFFKRAVLAANLERNINNAKFVLTDDAKINILRTRMARKSSMDEASRMIDNATPDQIKTLLKEAGLEDTKYATLNNLIESGQLNLVREETFSNTTKQAYDFVYQTQLEGDNVFSRFAKKTINAHREVPFLISSFMPFPRFIASQLKFQYEMMPGIGLLPLDKLGSKTPLKTRQDYFDYYFKGGEEGTSRMAKQIAGGMMLTAAYSWRAKQGETNNWYEFKDSNGNIVNGQAVYGPFSIFMLAADYIYRAQEGTLTGMKPSRVARDLLQATLGSTFRTGLGLYTLDKLAEDVVNGKPGKALVEPVANLIQTFTIPAGIARDVMAQFDENFRGIPETRTGEVNVLDAFFQRATRNLPKNFAIEMSEDPSILERMFVGTRAKSPVQSGELKQINPLEKQIFGFSKRPAKNSLQEEMTRLNISTYDMYRRDSDELRDMYVRDILSDPYGSYNLNKIMGNYIRLDDEYNRYGDSADDNAIKRNMLINKAKELVQVARGFADERIKNEASDSEVAYNSIITRQFNRFTDRKQDAMNAFYRKLYGGDSIMKDRDKIINVDGKQMTVMGWALSVHDKFN